MARKFLIVNRNLVATPLERRKTGWRADQNPNRGHPMVSRRYEINYDYLRISSARYYSWFNGTNANSYSDFKYLQDAELSDQGSVESVVGVNSLTPENIFEKPDISYAVAELGINDLSNITSLAFGTIPFGFNGQIIYNLILSGANDQWNALSNNLGVEEQYKELFNIPFWSNWQAYVLGGGAVPDRNFFGLFGDSGGQLYLDHKFEKTLPTKDQYSVATNYNYYNSFFDELGSKSEISELYIPNLYTVYSIAGNGESYLYEDLYDDSSSSRDWVTTQLVEPSLAPSIEEDFLTDNQVPIGQVQALPQTQDSILSRFTRKDFSDDLSSLEKLNKHLGLAPELLVGPNSLLTDMSARQGSYPYSAEVSFPLAGTGDLFEDANIDNLEALKFFLFEIIKANILNFNTGSYDFYQKINFSALESDEDQNKYYGFDWTGTGNWIPENNPQATQPYVVNAIDLKNLFNSIFNQLGSSQSYAEPDQGETYYGFINQIGNLNVALVQGTGSIVGQEYFQIPITSSISDDDQYNVFTNGAQEFIVNLADELSDNFRNYSQMMEGKDSPNWTLAYKLDKHKVNVTTGEPLPEPIQSIYFPNVGGAVKYIDTQVKFGERYLYKAYSYDLVVGNQYKYVNPQVFPPLPSAYPSLLGSLMGFDQGFGLFDVGPGTSWQVFSGREIYVGNTVNFTELFGFIGAPSLILFTSQAGNAYAQNPWFNENYSFYFDYYRSNVDNPSLETEELDGVVLGGVQGALGGVTKRVLLGGTSNSVASKIEQILGTGWRVRFAQNVDNPGSNEGKFVIGRLSDLSDLTDLERVALLTELNSESLAPIAPDQTSIAAIQNLFDIPTAINISASSEEISFLFRTGPHGSNPTQPWDLSRAGEAEVQVQNYKSVKVLELPYFETNVFEVVDLPPQFPDVDIVPLKGESKRIKILLNENATKNTYLPISIEDEDDAKYEEIRIGQGKEPGEALLFGSDDSLVSFQVYRLDTPPTTYRDFAGQRRYTLETVTSTGRSITTASTLDNVEPNAAYYYCFRTIDKNGFVSVPSPIIKVQMVDDNGRIYPIVEPYDLPSADTRKAEKTFRRYLEIDTSLDSKTIIGIDPGAETAGSPLSPPAGVGLSGSVWGENTTFKVRITSKDTGRKIDLNLNFNVEGISNPNLQDN
jgi:hypothetical protein